MTKRALLSIIGLMIGLFVVVILILRFVFKMDAMPIFSPDSMLSTKIPPVTSDIPQSLDKDVGTWTGILSLEPQVTLKVGETTYNLNAEGQDTKKFLQMKGYVSGDTVNVLGKTVGNTIFMVGLNKYIKK